MTRTRKILLLGSVSAFALVLRIGLALRSPNIFFPDEIFQTLEPAHRLAFGYGVISWEWRLGIRSWAFPAFLAGIMRATSWMGPGSSGYQLGVFIALSLLSLLTVWFGYKWAKRSSGTPAAVIAALACAFYFGLVYFAPKAFTEVVAGQVMLPGLYLGVYGQQIGERRRLFLAGIFSGLAACLRVQLLPALLFAALYFCYPRWRARILSTAAGFLTPIVIFGVVDWMTWSYPWQSFVRNYTSNVVSGIGKDFAPPEPWYWYLLAIVVLLGPALLLVPHGTRKSPFLAIFCAVIVLSHSFIPHKEIRFLYPILAPAVTLAAIGFVELIKELKGSRLFSNPRWVVATGVAFLLISSVLLAALCSNWYKTRWGTVAFDRLSTDPSVCGVGIYDVIWWESGGYTHLHRNVPIIPLNNATELFLHAPQFNALIAPENTQTLPPGFVQSRCWMGVCLLERSGSCAPSPADDELNAYLKRIDR